MITFKNFNSFFAAAVSSLYCSALGISSCRRRISRRSIAALRLDFEFAFATAAFAAIAACFSRSALERGEEETMKGEVSEQSRITDQCQGLVADSDTACMKVAVS